MRLHYNTSCTHQELVTTPMRALYTAGRCWEALKEINRLNELQLETFPRLVVNIHEVLVLLCLRRVPYPRAARRLGELAPRVQELGDITFTAEFCARRIKLAAQYGDHELAVWLTQRFFAPPMERTVITESYWRLAQGASAYILKGPAAAIPFYQTVVHHLADANRPCLHEMAARRLALCVRDLGDAPTAVAVLRGVGLPASLRPEPGEIALADLVRVQLW